MRITATLDKFLVFVDLTCLFQVHIVFVTTEWTHGLGGTRLHLNISHQHKQVCPTTCTPSCVVSANSQFRRPIRLTFLLKLVYPATRFVNALDPNAEPFVEPEWQHPGYFKGFLLLVLGFFVSVVPAPYAYADLN